MKRIILASFSLLLISSTALSQKNVQMAEAKAAYLLAEEEFNAGKYESAISYLNQASEKLGATNAKILYLKILALQPLAEKDNEKLPALSQAIDAFEKAADIELFNEEKKLEIYKLKLKTSRSLEALPKNAVEIAALKHMKVFGWKLGMNLEELQEAEPAFFTSAIRESSFDQDKYKGAYRKTTYITLSIKNAVLTRMEAFSLDGRSDPNLMDVFKSRMGGNPSDTTITKNEKNAKNKTISRTITWVEGNVKVVLTQNVFLTKGTPLNGTIFLSLSNDLLSK